MKYVIYFQPRSGSTNLAARLNYPEAGHVNGFELLSRETVLQLSLATPKELRKFDPSLKSAIITRFFALHKDKRTVGFKVAPYQMRDDVSGVFQQTQKSCQKMIFLYRANFVRVAISQIWSLARAKQNLAAKLTAGEPNTVLKMHIEEELFDYYLKDSILERDNILSLSRLQNDKLVISYEELYGGPNPNEEAVFDYLGIDKSEALPSGEFTKIHSDDLHDHIANFDQVVEWIRRYGCDETYLKVPAEGGASSHPKQIVDVSPTRVDCGKQSTGNTSSKIARARRPVAKPSSGTSEILALIERAATAETYSASLVKELTRAKKANEALEQRREKELKASERHVAALSRRVSLAEIYTQDLLHEQVKLKQALEIEKNSRSQELTVFQLQLSKAVERAERAERYHEVLLKEQTRLEHALTVQGREQEAEQERAQLQLARTIERAERAELYHKALLEEEAKLKRALEVQGRHRETDQAQAQVQLAGAIERAERAESYHGSLLDEQSKLKEALGAERNTSDRERADAAAQLEAATDRAIRAEAYHKALIEELSHLKRRLEARQLEEHEAKVGGETTHHPINATFTEVKPLFAKT
jgi:hypothetical protein